MKPTLPDYHTPRLRSGQPTGADGHGKWKEEKAAESGSESLSGLTEKRLTGAGRNGILRERV